MTRPKTRPFETIDTELWVFVKRMARAEAIRRAWCDCCEKDPSKDDHAKGCPLRGAKPAGGDL